MTYMYIVVVTRDLNTGRYRLPAGLSVRVPHDQMSNPLYSVEGKRRIAEAFAMQCGIDMSSAIHYISTAYMEARRM
jgi:hypothetical protein